MATTLEIQQNLVADTELFFPFFDDEAGKNWFVKKIVAYLSTSPDVEGAGHRIDNSEMKRTVTNPAAGSRQDNPPRGHIFTGK
jgi:hypothetical protein